MREVRGEDRGYFDPLVTYVLVVVATPYSALLTPY